MPLSENEQRILRQIEQQLERDPTFSTRGYRIPRRRVAALALGALAGITVTVLVLAVNVWLSIGAFVLTLALASMLEREVRVITREKVGALPISAWLGGGRRPRSGRGSERRPSEEYDG